MARASSRRYMQWVGDVSGGGNFAFRLLLVYWSRNPMVVFDSSGCCVLADFVWCTARHFSTQRFSGFILPSGAWENQRQSQKLWAKSPCVQRPQSSTAIDPPLLRSSSIFHKVECSRTSTTAYVDPWYHHPRDHILLRRNTEELIDRRTAVRTVRTQLCPCSLQAGTYLW